jgi:lysozyme
MAPLTGPLCSVGLVVALPLVMGGLPGSALVRSFQPKSLPAAPPSETATAPISLPPMGRMQAASQSFGSAGPGVYRMTPERRALLNTIRFAEGTWTNGRGDGYRMLYGGGQFRDMARHPEFVVTSGYSSAAAGAYQFLPATWNEAARRLRLPDFQPASQDQAALYLMEKRGALARFDRQGLSHDVLALLAPEWASLPTHHGGSYYGQPVKGAEELRRFYSEDLARQRGLTV